MKYAVAKCLIMHAIAGGKYCYDCHLSVF